MMEATNEFVNLTAENIDSEHLCCIIRTKKQHPGVEAKRQWLKEQLPQGHVFRKLNAKATVFIEYAPLEKAWVPIVGDNYIYIYCLWVLGDAKGKGYGKALMEYCIEDAKANGKSGVCMLGSAKQKSWLSDQSFAKKFGFKQVECTANGYELLALSFDSTLPHFADQAKQMRIDDDQLCIYYDCQCPYVYQVLPNIQAYCEANAVEYKLIQIESLSQAKALPCVFNNFAVFYKGRFETVNLLDNKALERILKK